MDFFSKFFQSCVDKALKQFDFKMFSDSFYQTIETQYGPVKGIKKFGCYGDEYFSFQGIPYMKPPVGKLRFRVSLQFMKYFNLFITTSHRTLNLQIIGRKFWIVHLRAQVLWIEITLLERWKDNWMQCKSIFTLKI